MKNNKHYLLIVTLLLSITMFAQEELQLTKKDSIVKSSWMLGLGYNFVDDSGDVANGLFNFKEEWNSTPYPNRLSLGRYFKSGVGVEAIASYNKYKEGKVIDGVIVTDETDYLGFDARLTYDLNKLIGQTAWFDPYIGAGLGYTDANNVGRGTYNAIVGFRTWFSDRIGLDFSSSGKWAMGNEGTNHLQHSVGVVYQFGIEKGLSKKGEEKLALIQAQEKEKQRVNDSIANTNRIKEEMLLAEKLAKEKEAARLAALEKEKIEQAKRERIAKLQGKIKDYGLVYFSLNSSYINRNSRKVLESLATLLKETPDLNLTIASHTDSRGSSAYNKTLSQRRVENTKAYLTTLGIEPSRLTTKAYGEEKLLNECGDGVYCPESKHKVNRRSEFLVLEF